MTNSDKKNLNYGRAASADAAHSPGHKKMNLKTESSENAGKVHAQNASDLNRMADSDKIYRNESPQRRIISGAALGKTGQRNKE